MSPRRLPESSAKTVPRVVIQPSDLGVVRPILQQTRTAPLLQAEQHAGGSVSATSWRVALLAVFILGSAATAAAEFSYVGSSTIADHIIPAAAEAFATKTVIKVGSIAIQGSGQGLELVVRGTAPLAGVSRSLTVVEKQQRIYYQTIGYDAVGVYVHGSNPVLSLSKAALKGIYTGRIRNWKEVGGRDALIIVITQDPGNKRAIMVEFRDQVMDGAAYREDRRQVVRQPDQVAALLSEPLGITAVSLASAAPGINAVDIEGFPPDPRSVRSGAYLLSRPLLLVTPARPDPDARRFVEFMLSPEGQAIVARKFITVR